MSFTMPCACLCSLWLPIAFAVGAWHRKGVARRLHPTERLQEASCEATCSQAWDETKLGSQTVSVS